MSPVCAGGDPRYPFGVRRGDRREGKMGLFW